jgi:DNA invertase Pin-like site-specific DNA recombinase
LAERDAAIHDAGLVDTGLGWTVSASGWKDAWKTTEWVEMVAAARADAFDIVVVAPFDRFVRNLKVLLVQLEDVLHPLGVAVYFPEEEVLSSKPEHWSRLVALGTDAEQWSRTMSSKLRKGHAVLRRKGEPGGHAPFGFVRVRPEENKPKVLVEVPEDVATVRTMYTMAATGLTDRQIAQHVGRKKTWVAEVLTNPIYRGELTDGSQRRLPLVTIDLWNRVQEQRSRYARRHTGNVTKRTYPLSGLLFCRGCGRAITGHCDRYRHVDACDGWRASKPADANPRNRGESYAREMLEFVVPTALASIKVSAALLAETQAAVAALAPQPDHYSLARVATERRAATERFLVDRDMAALTRAMESLDRQEAAALATNITVPTPSEIAAHLSDLPGLYAMASDTTRQSIARALFERVEALGPERYWLHPSAEARQEGWIAAMTGDFSAEVQLRAGRGERI